MLTELKQALQELLGERLSLDASLQPFTSLKIGGTAMAVAYPKSVAEVVEVIALCRKHQVGFRVIGGGTNLLVPDEGYPGVVLITATHMTSFAFEPQEDHTVRLQADAGVRMSKLLSVCMQEGYQGLEFAAGIPGTFGGVLWMNGGTKDGSVDQVFHSMCVIDKAGDLQTLDASEVDFQYRSSKLPRSTVILTGKVTLKRGDPLEIKQAVERVKGYRKNQPLKWPNAGSTFKNPEGDFAGRLIEASGLKGRRVGGAMISSDHANFVINTGDATAKDVLELIQTVKQTVLEQHGRELETELEVLK